VISESVAIRLGTVSQVETLVSTAVAKPVADVHAAVRTQPVVDADETRWPQGNGSASKGYRWAVVTTSLACFLLRPGRDQQVAKELLGQNFAGILGSDRSAAYHGVADCRRPFGWLHLRREWLAFIDRGGPSAVLGQQLLAWTDERGFATMNADRVPPDVLQALMQHQDYQTTQRYINIARQLKPAAHNLFVPELPKLAQA